MVAASTAGVCVFTGSIAFASFLIEAARRARRLQIEDAPQGPVKLLDVSDASAWLAVGKRVAKVHLSLLWVLVCEKGRLLITHGDKAHDLDFFALLVFALMLTSFARHPSGEQSRDSSLLNREQTDEWKGWMQVMFLLYHYFHASETYNLIRVLISCYVWMTGFGNFSFFYVKKDYSFRRFASMMWRLNFLGILLVLVTNNPYVLYYILPLHTFYFCVTYAVMGVGSNYNHSKYGGQIKLFIASCVLYAIWEFPNNFDFVWMWLSTDFHPGAPVGAYGTRYEWRFRSGLDHYAALFGMSFALGYPIATAWLGALEKSRLEKRIKISVGVILGIVFVVWVLKVFSLPKLAYNEAHAFVFWIPLSFYVFVRNSTPFLRSVYLPTLASIGKFTLETYMFQHHIWLNDNAKSVVRVLPSQMAKVNMLLVTAIYVQISKTMYYTTIELRAALLPGDSDVRCLEWLVRLGACLGVSHFVGVLIAFLSNDNELTAAALIASSSVAGGFGVCAFVSKIVSGFRVANWKSLNVMCLLITVAFIVKVCTENSAFPSASEMPKIDCVSEIMRGHWHDTQTEAVCPVDSVCHEPHIWIFDSDKACASAIPAAVETLRFVGGSDVIPLYEAAKRKSSKEVEFHKTSSVEELVRRLADLDPSSSVVVVAGLGFGDDEDESALDELPAVAYDNVAFVQPVALRSGFQKSEIDQAAVATRAKKAIRVTEKFSTSFVLPTYDMTLNSRKSDCLDGSHYADEVWDVALEILLKGAVVVSRKSDSQQQPPPINKQKGSGGGVPSSPSYGLLTLLCFWWGLFWRDSFVFAQSVSWVVSGGKTLVSWESAVKELHEAIGVDSGATAHEPAEAEEEMELTAGAADA